MGNSGAGAGTIVARMSDIKIGDDATGPGNRRISRGVVHL
jgi:hypothetical protein